MNKLLLLVGVAFLFAIGAQAQTSYGVKAGLNLGKFSNMSHITKENRKNNLSFHLTGYTDIPVALNFSIQPGISLQGKGDKAKAGGEMLGATSVNLMSVEIPVNAVYYIPTRAAGSVFLGTGPYIGCNIYGKNKYDGQLFQSLPGVNIVFVKDPEHSKRESELRKKWAQGESDVIFTGDDREINRIDAGVNFLTGFKLTNGFLVNAGYGLGLTNLSPSDNSSVRFSNRVLSFSVGFQF